MKHSGRIVPHAIANAESEPGTSTVTASPSAQKQNIATPSVNTAAGSAPHTTSKPYRAAPTATTTIAAITATRAAEAIRPAMYTHGGSGVDRTRLRIPSSRASVIEEITAM